MSIYVSWDSIGQGDDSGDNAPGIVYDYQESHIYPNDAHQHGFIDIAHIPSWCVPGNDYDDLADPDATVAPWLRMSMTGSDGYERHTALLDEQAVRSLAEQLTQWLQTPKEQTK